MCRELHLYPKGGSKAKGKHLSLFIALDNANMLTNERKLYTQYNLRIKKQDGQGVDHTENRSDNWGYISFISISDLYNTSKGFLVNDTLIVELKVAIEE
ncbi:Ubiquitin carboxyl-terminal hydrolase 12, partial [Bienertia sinuspersici]